MQPARVPWIQLLPLSNQKLGFADFVRVHAFIHSKHGPLTVRWELYSINGFFCFVFNAMCFCSDNASIDIGALSPQIFKNFSEETTAQMNQIAVSISIPVQGMDIAHETWSGLAYNNDYLLRLSATNKAGCSTADYMFTTYSEFTQQSIEVTPTKHIYALETPVQFLIPKINQGNKSYTIRYGIRTLMTGNRSTVSWGRTSMAKFHVRILPSGSYSTFFLTMFLIIF